MTEGDLGRYFIKDGEIYNAIGYINSPALELRNIRTGERRTIVIDSLLSHEYSKLFSIPCEEGQYNLDNAEEVSNIVVSELDKR